MPRRTDRRVLLLVAADGRTPLTPVLWRCTSCGELKPEADFTVTDGATGRRRASCRPCEADRLFARSRAERRRTRPSRRQQTGFPPFAEPRTQPRTQVHSVLGTALRQLMDEQAGRCA